MTRQDLTTTLCHCTRHLIDRGNQLAQCQQCGKWFAVLASRPCANAAGDPPPRRP